MIKERYVSFEIAKLLKEKGFNEPCRSYFINDTGDYRRCAVEITNKLCSSEQLLRPTLYMAMEWLRENKNILIIIEPHAYDYVNEKNKSYSCSLWIGDNYYEYLESKDYPIYEEAVEEVLKYILKNLV